MKDVKRLVVAAALVVAACAPAETPPTATAATPATTVPSPTLAAAGPLPIVITTDMAGDDLMAVMAMLREPAVDVLAIAVDGNGEVHCAEGLRNMRRLLGAFDRSEIPIGCGREQPGPNGRLFPDEWRAGADAFYGVELPPVAGSSLGQDAAALIIGAVEASAEPVMLVPLGPWTTLADAFTADPSLAGRIAGIHAMAGAIDVPGNIAVDEVTFEHGVEWNVGVDPDAFAAVLASNVPVTLVPLDATNDVPVPSDFASTLEADHVAAGADIAYEMFARSPFLTVDTSFWDTLAVMALVDPTLVTWEDLTARVEIDGPSSGRIVRDPAGRPLRAAMSADRDAFMAAFLGALRRGAPRPEPFTVTGTLVVRWDGTTCWIEGDPPATAGLVRITFTNDATADVALALGGVVAPHTWAEVIALLETIDLEDPDLQVPDWLIEIEGGASAGPGADAVALATLPAGAVGAVCATGTWPDLTFHDGGSFDLAE
jgi:inosine-uridine nucleoside N-ribohydrolase